MGAIKLVLALKWAAWCCYGNPHNKCSTWQGYGSLYVSSNLSYIQKSSMKDTKEKYSYSQYYYDNSKVYFA